MLRDEFFHIRENEVHTFVIEMADVIGFDTVLLTEVGIVHIDSDGVGISRVEADDPLVIAVLRELAHCVGVIDVRKSRCGDSSCVIPRSHKDNERVRIGLKHTVKHNIDASHKGLGIARFEIADRNLL